ncbi:hypothetical protein K443DRAFT_390205 [Laccaria amethystina LaAM-08-1]|uniref:Uncharacterized protein n=1 Tax=Laccaria amethystina LaAM-08-1 TaxID=1095629 RepID=A0A0C9YNL4_9AGAR|nr:hypothetical protein K443DRAFT_390205 [Laccaria amethystina LaAM-08-1]
MDSRKCYRRGYRGSSCEPSTWFPSTSWYKEGKDLVFATMAACLLHSASGSAARRKAVYLMIEPVHSDRCLVPDEESLIKDFCAVPLRSCYH